MGLVHVGAHTNTMDKHLEEKVHHRTPFRRSVDEGLLDCKRVIQIGIRGSSRTLDPYRYSRSQVMDGRPSLSHRESSALSKGESTVLY